MSASAIPSLADRRILITGGANGLGADMAAHFVEAGARVLLADIDGAMAERRAADLGPAASAIGCDIASMEDVARLGQAAREFGGVDALVNNAAFVDVAHDSDLIAADMRVVDRTFAVNVRGTMLVSRQIIPQLIEAGGGAVVTVVSRQGIAPPLSGRRMAYGTSKAALIMLARHIAVAYGKQGIRSNAVAPGTIKTERMVAELPAERLAQSRRNVLLPHLGQPTDISQTVGFLIGDGGRYITGQTIQVDGGVLTGLHE